MYCVLVVGGKIQSLTGFLKYLPKNIAHLVHCQNPFPAILKKFFCLKALVGCPEFFFICGFPYLVIFCTLGIVTPQRYFCRPRDCHCRNIPRGYNNSQCPKASFSKFINIPGNIGYCYIAKYVLAFYIIMFNVHCFMFIVQCSTFNVHCSLFNVQCSMFNVQCSLFIVQCSMLCSMFFFLSCSNYVSQTKRIFSAGKKKNYVI